MTRFSPYDHLLLVVLLALAVLEWRWVYPRFLAALQRGRPGARAGLYTTEILSEWALVALVVLLWMVEGRPWSALLLGTSSPVRLMIGWSLAILYVILALQQSRALLGRPERLARLMESMGRAQALLPRTRAERNGFAALSVTAGICEEFLFRGFVLWYATQWGGPIVGFVVSTIFFGFIHIYLGPRHVPRTAIAGIFFYAVAMTAGSLIPAMVVHATADLVSGGLAYRAFRERHGAQATPTPAA